MSDLVRKLRHEAWHTSYKPSKPWDLLVEAADELERLTRELEQTRDSAAMVSGLFSRNIMAMQAALADMMLRGDKQGWRWIINTLDGPGLLPDMEAVKAAGGAQAWFDAELATEEARVAAIRALPEEP